MLHLWSLTSEAELSGPQFFATAQTHGYYHLLFLTQALEKHVIDNLEMIVITNHLHDVSGAEQTFPEKATLLGPCKVISQEYLNISCRCLDVSLPAPRSRQEAGLIDQVLAESLERSTDTLVAYRGRQRLAQTFEKSSLLDRHDAARHFRERGVYLITGGLGSVGLFIAEYLAATFKARLILVGRSALPERAAWDEWLAKHAGAEQTAQKIRKVLKLEELGAEVVLAVADVADVESLQSVLNMIDERFGQLHGVLHAAGVTSGKSVVNSLSEIGYNESESQFRAKVYGLYALEKVLAGRDLDFCLLFSSNAAVLGGLGSIAYSAANNFMDAFASLRSRDSLFPWISANWDAWPSDIYPESARRRSIDEYAMTASESVRALEAVVSQAPAGQVVVSTGDLAARINLWLRRQFSTGVEDVKESHPRPKLETGFVAPENEIQQTIAYIWQQLFGIERVGLFDNFFDLGGHSLLATRIVTRLRETLRIKLPLRCLFENPTVESLALEIANLQLEVQTPDHDSIKVSADEPAVAELLASIDQLPEEQIDLLLDKYIS